MDRLDKSVMDRKSGMDRPDIQFWYGQTRYANLLWIDQLCKSGMEWTDQMYKAGMNRPEEQPWHGETRYTNIRSQIKKYTIPRYKRLAQVKRGMGG